MIASLLTLGLGETTQTYINPTIIGGATLLEIESSNVLIKKGDVILNLGKISIPI